MRNACIRCRGTVIMLMTSFICVACAFWFQTNHHLIDLTWCVWNQYQIMTFHCTSQYCPVCVCAIQACMEVFQGRPCKYLLVHHVMLWLQPWWGGKFLYMLNDVFWQKQYQLQLWFIFNMINYVAFRLHCCMYIDWLMSAHASLSQLCVSCK